MRAAFLKTKGGPEDLMIGELPRPSPGPGDVLVKVHATAIMPTELRWFPTFSLPSGAARPFPIVLSHEFCGDVAELGENVRDLKVGDRVYGMNDWFTNGAQAEYCVASASFLSIAPRTLASAHAAVVPISALTAWQGLFVRSQLQAGQRVLVHGASGGVGAFAVQLAHRHGAHVIATASAVNRDFVRGLGAEEVIDYRTTRFEDVAQAVDVVFDTQGGDTLERSWRVLKPGGTLVTVATSSESVSDRRIREAFLLVQPNRLQLEGIARMIDAAELQVFTGGEYSLTQVREAYAAAERDGRRGKIALTISP